MRNEDYDRELLAGVTMICVMLTAVVSLYDTAKPSAAKSAAQASVRVEQLAPVRVVGTPFVLNTNPSERIAKD